jgi:hypothetical protein
MYHVSCIYVSCFSIELRETEGLPNVKQSRDKTSKRLGSVWRQSTSEAPPEPVRKPEEKPKEESVIGEN